MQDFFPQISGKAILLVLESSQTVKKEPFWILIDDALLIF